MRIIIKNWRAFNPRQDVKKSSWFRLAHDLFEDPDFYDFTHAELLAWIYLLCQASKKNTDSIRVNLTHLEKVGRIKERDFLNAVRKLEELQCISVDVTDTLRERDEHDTHTNATNERTNGRTEVDSQGEIDLPSPSWLAETWNEHCGELPKVRDPSRLSAARLKGARERLKETPNRALWIDAIQRVARSEFCLGKRNKPGPHASWRADFDFLLQPGRLDQTLEGKFDNRTQPQVTPLSAYARRLAAETGEKEAESV